MRRELVITLVLAASGAVPAQAWQADRDAGRIAGRVVEQGSGRPLDRVIVTLSSRDGLRVIGAVETDKHGRFEFGGLGSELLSVRAERIGYYVRSDSIRTLARRTLDVVLTLSSKVVALEPLEITVRARWLEVNGFYQRREEGMRAHIIDRDMIEKRLPAMITELLDDAPGVNVIYLEPGRRTIRFNRHLPLPPEPGRRPVFALDRRNGLDARGCEPDLYIDGREHRNSSTGLNKVDNFDAVPVSAIEAVEVYVGNTPAQFYHACGVILIWTRRSGPGAAPF